MRGLHCTSIRQALIYIQPVFLTIVNTGQTNTESSAVLSEQYCDNKEIKNMKASCVISKTISET